MGKLEILLCEWCGREVRRRGSRGPTPRYCQSACRVAAHRARRATAAVRMEMQAEAGSLEPVVHADPPPQTSADEQVARAYVEAKSLASVFARLGAEARPSLAWRCTRVSQALTTAINETLGKD
jgi:hypothetical protein